MKTAKAFFYHLIHRILYKEYSGDLFRGTVIVTLLDPYKDHENIWIWFHLCFQTSQDVADSNELYKYLDDEWFDEDVMKIDDTAYRAIQADKNLTERLEK